MKKTRSASLVERIEIQYLHSVVSETFHNKVMQYLGLCKSSTIAWLSSTELRGLFM